MICEKCGVTVPEGRHECPNCGARVYPAPSYSSEGSDVPSAYGIYKQKELKKRRNRIAGIILIIIGIILAPVAIITIFMPVGWILFLAIGVCLLAGLITYITNLGERPTFS
jgi:uncharacterized membrane protein YvbJ